MMFGAFVCRNYLLASTNSEFRRVGLSDAAGRTSEDFEADEPHQLSPPPQRT
jgi:hypothetical protein